MTQGQLVIYYCPILELLRADFLCLNFYIKITREILEYLLLAVHSFRTIILPYIGINVTTLNYLSQ